MAVMRKRIVTRQFLIELQKEHVLYQRLIVKGGKPVLHIAFEVLVIPRDARRSRTYSVDYGTWSERGGEFNSVYIKRR